MGRHRFCTPETGTTIPAAISLAAVARHTEFTAVRVRSKLQLSRAEPQ